MLNWIKRLFSPNPPDVFSVRERLIYTYWDGRKWVKSDPMVLHKRIMAVGPELDADMTAASFPGYKASAAAHDNYVAKVRDVFGVKTFADGGLTDLEVADLLDHFMNYCNGEKKNTSPTPTSAEGTSPTTGSSSAAGSPTPNTSGSGSTDGGSSAGTPTPSPPGSG